MKKEENIFQNNFLLKSPNNFKKHKNNDFNKLSTSAKMIMNNQLNITYANFPKRNGILEGNFENKNTNNNEINNKNKNKINSYRNKNPNKYNKYINEQIIIKTIYSNENYQTKKYKIILIKIKTMKNIV